MAFKATKEQKLAIETDGSVLVAAAAGSGKTAVLVERVIRKLSDPINPIDADRLLIVTFTNAAAAEMRQRIEKRLASECKLHPDDAGLRRQKRLLASAQICTIDSFCINLVRENFEKVGIEPNFKMADNSLISIISNDVMSRVIESHISCSDERFIKLLEITGCEYDESNLKSAVYNLFIYSRQMPFPEHYLKKLIAPYERPFNKEHIWYKEAFIAAEEYIDLFCKSVEKMAECAPYTVKSTDKLINYADDAIIFYKEIKEAFDSGDFDLMHSTLQDISFARMPATDKTDSTSLDFSSNKSSAASALEKLKSYFEFSSAEIEAEYFNIAPAVKLLIDITLEYAHELFEEFKKENILTFYNTEQLALSLLCEYKDGKTVIKEDVGDLLSKYDEVLVDEFQDVNDLQDALFFALSNREEKLFVVGDIKQSIYGFRGSNPANFLEKKNRFIPIDEASDSDSKKIILSDNFRSKAGVCNYVNFFFSQLMQGQLGSIVYDDEEKLSPAANYPECEAAVSEILLVNCADQGFNADERFKAESQSIAEYIIKTINEGPVIRETEDTLRCAEYSDFTILLRSMSRASILAGELKERGIPVNYSADSFLESNEITTFLSLLKIIDNPDSDIDLLCVALSPIFGFTSEELAVIRTDFKHGSLFSALTFSAQNGNTKAIKFLDDVFKMRRTAATMSIGKLIYHLLYDTDYINIVSVLPGGPQRRANLLKLADIATNFASSRNDSITGFINYMNNISDDDIKTPDTSGGNCVRIMTMHKSKGLQFPICIIADLSKAINDSDARDSMIFDDKLGVSFRYYDENKGYKFDSLGRKLLSRKMHLTNIEEQLRLYYVALTRAENRIVQVISVNNADEKLSSLASKLSEEPPFIGAGLISSSTSIGDWVLLTALLHPQAKEFRDRCDTFVPIVKSESDLKITVKNITSIDTSPDKISQETDPDGSFNTEFSNQISENISFVYPFEALKEIQAKNSVSSIVGAAENNRFIFTERPAFMEKEGLTAAGKGTAMHHIMQYISFDKDIDIEAEIERLYEWQFITETEAKCADRKAIEKFFKSEIFSRISASVNVRREMRFLTEIPANQLDTELDSAFEDEKIVIQGAVDLCFEEDDGIVVLDFKTDRTTDPQHFIDAYSFQLDVYSKACEKIFGKPVKEKIIYSFAADREIIL